ncbi:MAG: hypothetical protein RLZ05_851, partial [Bacteroidota bacterium]
CIEKFEQENGVQLVKNTNRKNYEPLSAILSEISNQLPFTSSQYGHQPYEADTDKKEKEYPFRKYDITGGQVRDALMGLVANPRTFLVDTCYIYLYGMGRKAFESNPVDLELLAEQGAESQSNSYSIIKDNHQLKAELSKAKKNAKSQLRNNWIIAGFIIFILSITVLVSINNVNKKRDEIIALKNDFNITPFPITTKEKKELEGIWLCYSGSPQARLSDPDRANKVVLNISEFKETNGYFTYKRYGASFNHTGFAQFENPNTISIHSRLLTLDQKVLSPRHSILELDTSKEYLNVISASWNFDVGDKNRVIGIREVYKKIGEGGELQEILNSVENAECKCKIIRWKQKNGDMQEFRLKNILIDSLYPAHLRQLINEKSILVKNLEDTLMLKKLP